MWCHRVQDVNIVAVRKTMTFFVAIFLLFSFYIFQSPLFSLFYNFVQFFNIFFWLWLIIPSIILSILQYYVMTKCRQRWSVNLIGPPASLFRRLASPVRDIQFTNSIHFWFLNKTQLIIQLYIAKTFKERYIGYWWKLILNSVKPSILAL